MIIFQNFVLGVAFWFDWIEEWSFLKYNAYIATVQQSMGNFGNTAEKLFGVKDKIILIIIVIELAFDTAFPLLLLGNDD